jgi:3-(3-hydroxy-phenyl)propionate hydroxylase
MSVHDNHPPSEVDVLVVGGGPTGLTAASLLGSYGLGVALVEKNMTTSDEAKAISLDDESLRALQAAGLDEAVYPIIVPGTGTRYYAANGKPLFHARGPRVRRHGHPFKNPFAQPDLERALASGLDAFDNVGAYFGVELVDFTQDEDHVVAQVRCTDGSILTTRAKFLLGCDGGRSTVRELLGIEMSGQSFSELWLVADTLEDSHDERYGMHVGDPHRPHVIVPGLNGRCRYEFKLKDGEAVPGKNPPFELVRRLVERYRPLTPAQLERSVVYGFHAIIADHFGRRRCFLLGDAAHMMPPFAGQGLNSGVRDAINLCWKVAAVIRGTAESTLLDSYETERQPHARATIALSVKLGDVVMTSSPVRAWTRDWLVRAALVVPLSRRYLTEMRYRPKTQFRSGFLWRRPGRTKDIVGTIVPQTNVLDGTGNVVRRLDDILGSSGAVLGVGVDQSEWTVVEAALAAAPGALEMLFKTRIDVAVEDRSPRPTSSRGSSADVEGAREAFLRPAHERFVLVRPDRVVAAVFRVDEAQAVAKALSALTSSTSHGIDPRPAHSKKVS